MTTQDIQPQTVRAHELYGDFWFNSDPILISALRGQVILVEFWDYTCLNCLRSLPYIKEWQSKYSKYGLVVVGVHTPMFPFGKNPEILQRAINRLQIQYPVVMDNEGLIAARYDSRSWPTIFLIDKDGFVRHQNVREGNYAATERALQVLLYDAGVGEELPLMMEPLRASDRTGALLYRATPELHTGYLRGSIGNVEGYSPESIVSYADPGIYLDGRFYAVGMWLNEKNCLRLDETRPGEGQIVLVYQALEVNAVIEPEGKKGVQVTVRQDDCYLNAANMGEDIRLSADGRSYLLISEPRMYNIVKNKEYGEHVLRLSTKSNRFAIYAFTFVSSVIPELISNN